MLHHALNAGLAEVIAVALHGQAIHAHHRGAAFGLLGGPGQHMIRNIGFSGFVGFHDRGDHILRHTGIVCQKLLGILGQAVAAVAKAGVVVVAADARVQPHALNDVAGVQALHFGIGVQLVKIGHPQRQIGVGKQLHGLGLGKAHKQRVDVRL